MYICIRMNVCEWVSEWVCVCVCVCVRIYAYIWVIYVTYSIKQVRYSGVNDGNTPIKHTPSHEQIRMTRLKTSELIWDHSCRLSSVYVHGPTTAQVEITWSFVSISSSYFIFQGKLTILLKSFVSGLLTNPCLNSITIHRLWPQLTLIHNWNFIRSTSIQRRSMLQLFRSSWNGVHRSKLSPTHVRYLFPHLTSPIIFPYFFQRRPRLCLDMVSSRGLNRLPKRRLYLSTDDPQILTVLSELPLAR